MHGLRRGTDITLLIPVLSTDAVFGSGPNTVDSDHTALGDVSLTVRQRLHHHLWQRGAWNTSLLGGVQMPTGDDDEIVDGTLLPAPLQAGSGSWDPFASLATTIELGRLRIDANAFYLLPTEGSQGFEAGDVFFDRDTSPLNYFRLSYSAISADRIPEGIAWLAANMRKLKP